jgi:O-antigen/teichoic acid export membrane protein
VLSDAWFPGWRAWVEVAGAQRGRAAAAGDGDGDEVPVYRANGMLRAVPVPPGRSTVRLRYFPMSVKVGLYGSFLGAVLLLLAAAYALWDRFVRVDHSDELSRVAVNSAGPMAAALLNKVLDFAFAMLALRILGPADAGKYYLAVNIIGFADIFTNFGLNLLTAREVARRPADGPRYLSHTAALRLVLWLVALPGLAGYVWLRQATGSPLAPDTVLAIALLAGALVPGNLNAALSSLFQAHERMVLPAGVTIVSTLVKVAAGALVLLAGFGFVGLAGVAIATNWVTFLVLAGLALREGYGLARGLSGRFLWAMVGISLPLMLNHLLQTVFFKVDVLLLNQLVPNGDIVVGWYSAAYKWVDALLIIPSYFTLALFPLLSRRAADDPEGFRRAYGLALRWLLSLALPIAVTTTFLAPMLVQLLAGSEYLPQGAQALQVMIWFLPLSFANGLTQYVLIAMDRQRWVTISFAIAVTFNLVANYVVIPGHTFGGLTIPAFTFLGAAVVTILSEVVLLLPFRRGLRDLAMPPLLATLWRPAMATSLLALALGGLATAGVPEPIAILAAAPLYPLGIWAVGGITDEDRALAARLLRRSGSAPAPAPGTATSRT